MDNTNITTPDSSAVSQVGVRSMRGDLEGLKTGQTSPAMETITLSGKVQAYSSSRVVSDVLEKKKSRKIWRWLLPILIVLVIGAGVYLILL